ncbi:MAG: hypothetical protein QOC59_1492 [Microbacteriaceae bacterium]|nr:hypothetical protein [Microbacteriaceae bacterium]
MSMREDPTRGPARPAPYAVVGVLLVIGIVVPLLVPVYATAAPPLFGLPFFYWYQMLWVVIEALLLLICYRIIRAEDRRRREAVSPAGQHPTRAQGRR